MTELRFNVGDLVKVVAPEDYAKLQGEVVVADPVVGGSPFRPYVVDTQRGPMYFADYELEAVSDEH